MANPKHVEWLKEGVKAWNKRRQENDFFPDFIEMIFQGVDLRGADLRMADLQGADLRMADLQGADLQGAVLRGVDLRGADLQGADVRTVALKSPDGQTGASGDFIKTDLSDAVTLTKKQLDDLYGDDKTLIPARLSRPAHWPRWQDNGLNGDFQEEREEGDAPTDINPEMDQTSKRADPVSPPPQDRGAQAMGKVGQKFLPHVQIVLQSPQIMKATSADLADKLEEAIRHFKVNAGNVMPDDLVIIDEIVPILRKISQETDKAKPNAENTADIIAALEAKIKELTKALIQTEAKLSQKTKKHAKAKGKLSQIKATQKGSVPTSMGQTVVVAAVSGLATQFGASAFGALVSTAPYILGPEGAAAANTLWQQGVELIQKIGSPQS